MRRYATTGSPSPLADFLRGRVERVLASFQAAGVQPAARDKGALERFLVALDEVGAAADALSSPKRGSPSASERASSIILVAADEAFVDEVRRTLGPVSRVEVARRAGDGCFEMRCSGGQR